MKTVKVLVNNITASLDTGEGDVFMAAESKIKNSRLKLKPIKYSIHKKSVDARKKSSVKLVYSVCIECECGDSFDVNCLKNHSLSALSDSTINVVYGSSAIDGRIVVVGMGPAGMFCALLLAECGYKPLVIERGDDVDTRIKKKESFYKDRVLDTESNIQFGAGGAGTFSDGSRSDYSPRQVRKANVALGQRTNKIRPVRTKEKRTGETPVLHDKIRGICG